MLNMRYAIRVLMLILGSLVLVGSWAATDSEEMKKALEQRVTKYWEARQVRDFRTVYEMESASRPGGWLTPDKAAAVIGMPVKNVKVEEVAVDGERATVRVNGEVLVGAQMGGWWKQTLKDTWVLIEGQWYHETKR